MQPIIMLPDDNMSGIIAGVHAPKICVDYLSHEWNEDDIWTSWKVMSKQKKEMSNGVRLENASWRTWAKQKYNLKTVNPDKLNWLKDSDVTWLYGPLHTAWSSHLETLPKSQKTEDHLNLMPSTTSTKSCLKKKSISEILRPMVKVKYGPLITSSSDSLLYKKEMEREVDTDSSDCETSSTCSSISGPETPTTSPIKQFFLPVEKNVSFNDRVEQCIAVESDDDVDDLHDSDASSDDGILMKSSPKEKKTRDLSTICKLEPTKLKGDRNRNNEFSSLYSNSRRRANSSINSSTTPSTSTSITESTSPSSSSTTPEWMYDEDDDFDLDLIDFDAAISSHLPYNQAEAIIPPPGPLDENEDDNSEDVIEKAVNIANGVREVANWCSDMVYMVFRGRVF